MPLDLQPVEETNNNHNITVIKIAGVGGAGGNAVNRMIEYGFNAVEYLAINTDAQALSASKADQRIQIGSREARGLGAGANPSVGKEAAEKSEEEIKKAIEGADLLFITAGMGGGTGTGAAPVVARFAKELDIRTIGIVTRPFDFEGTRRASLADEGIKNLFGEVDSLLVIPNQRLVDLDDDLTMREAFSRADDVLRDGIKGISEILLSNNFINADFADVKAVISGGHMAYMGTAEASGEGRAIRAAQNAIENPILETKITGAKNMLLNIVTTDDFTMRESSEACDFLKRAVSPDANIIISYGFDESLRNDAKNDNDAKNAFNDGVRITVIATGLEVNGSTQAEENPAEEEKKLQSNNAGKLTADNNSDSDDNSDLKEPPNYSMMFNQKPPYDAQQSEQDVNYERRKSTPISSDNEYYPQQNVYNDRVINSLDDARRSDNSRRSEQKSSSRFFSSRKNNDDLNYPNCLPSKHKR